MIENIIGQLLNSDAGAELLKTVQAKGLSAEQATSAVKATAEGALSQGEGGLASLAGNLLGGSGGLASLAGSLLGGGSAAAEGSSGFAAMVPAISQFVAQKTGLDPAMAQTVVTLALPKVMELLRSQAPAGTTEAGGKPGGLLGGLFG